MMNIAKRSLQRRLRTALASMAALLLAAGCATPGPTTSVDELPFDQAVATATDGLIAQTQKLPAFMAKLAQRTAVVDPMLEGGSGQQTALTRLLEEKVTARLRAGQIEVLPFQSANLGKAQYLLAGSVTRLQPPPGVAVKAGVRQPFQIHLSLLDIKTGAIVAHAASRARDDNLDTRPTPYYRDSPILVKDRVVDGYLRTAEALPGQQADPAYFERIASATAINEGTLAYNGDRFQEALDLYKAALAGPSGGEPLRALNGVYLASWKLGRTAEAEQAFGKVVAHGIANRSLGVKFLFNPNTTEFWSDAKVSGPYALWLRQIAKQTAAAKACMDVVGHTSRTGSEAYNDRLSEQRAAAIRQKLGAEAPELTARTKASGVGFRENIIGTGTDDAADALDRRVEFRMAGC